MGRVQSGVEMAYQPIETEMRGDTSRRGHREDIKRAADRLRREADKAACADGLDPVQHRIALQMPGLFEMVLSAATEALGTSALLTCGTAGVCRIRVWAGGTFAQREVLERMLATRGRQRGSVRGAPPPQILSYPVQSSPATRGRSNEAVERRSRPFQVTHAPQTRPTED
jgi:hypothetical protein